MSNSRSPVQIDPDWYQVGDLTPPTLSRNIRGPSGMIIGRVLRPETGGQFEGQIFNRGVWKSVGRFDEFDAAVAKATEPIA